MTLRRLELPDGQWADLLERPTHGDYRAILVAAERAERGDSTWTEWAETIGRRYCRAWMVRGDDGQPLDLSEWDEADPDIVDAICTEAQERYREWRAQRVPLATGRRRPTSPSGTSTPSGATPGEGPSPSPTPSSPTPSS